MADKQEYETYVKLGRRGLIERTPTSAREEIQMRFGGGWVRKGSPAAPSAEAVKKVEDAAEERQQKVEEARAERAELSADAAVVDGPDPAAQAPNTGTRKSTPAKATS